MPRATILVIVFLLVLGGGAVVVHHEFRAAQRRPAVERLLARDRLQQLAAAIDAYRGRWQAWPPTLFAAIRAARLPLGGWTYRYRPPEAGAAPGTVVCWGERCHPGIRAGEPFGAAGEVAAQDLPPAGWVLTADLRLALLPEDEWRRRVPAP